MSSVLSGSVGKGGMNRGPYVRAVQCLLNLSGNRVHSGMGSKLVMNGVLDKPTQDAIDLYQQKVMNMKRADGRVDKHGGMIRRLLQALPPKPSGSYSSPPWLKIACDEEASGVREKTGRPSNNRRIVEYLKTAAHLATIKDVITTKNAEGKKEIKESGYMMGEVDETPWCACFVNWCLKEAEKTPRKGARAESYKNYGTESVLEGNICVIHREPFSDSSSGWHVGFYIGGDPKVRKRVTFFFLAATKTTPCAGSGLLVSTPKRSGGAGRCEKGLRLDSEPMLMVSIASKSIACSALLAALIAGLASSCKQNAETPPPAAPPAPAPQPAAAEERAAGYGQAAPPPSPTQPPQPPEGMVYVPGGTFEMGPTDGMTEGEAPQRVQVSPFFIDRTEVTVAAYLACVQAKGCTESKPGEDCNATTKKPRLQHPMNCITHEQAEQYCASLAKRLPSGAEWEFAARGTDGRNYPWGDDAAGEQLCWQQRADGLNETTCPVGSFTDGASPFGALDMAGNVAEWTSTGVAGAAVPGAFSTRGGSYRFDPLDRAEPESAKIRADQSEPFGSGSAIPTLGVRCAKTL